MKYIKILSIIFLLLLISKVSAQSNQQVEIIDTQSVILCTIDEREVQDSAILIFKKEMLPDKTAWRVLHKIFLLKNGDYIEIQPMFIKYIMR